MGLCFIGTPSVGCHRISKAIKVKGGGRRRHFFHQIEPNWPLPYSTGQYHSWGMSGRRAGSPIAVFARVQCLDPKQGRKRFNSIVKTIHASYLLTIYLWLLFYRSTLRTPLPHLHWNDPICRSLFKSNHYLGSLVPGISEGTRSSDDLCLHYFRIKVCKILQLQIRVGQFL